MTIYLDGSLGERSTGNIQTDSYFIGNGFYLTDVQVSSGVPGSNIYVDPNGNTVVNVAGNAIMDINAGGANVAGNIISTGNIAGGNLVTGGNVVSNNVVSNSVTTNNVTSSGTVTAGNVVLSSGGLTFSDGTTQTTAYSNAVASAFLASGTDSSDIITTANVSGSYILGNGSQLTGISVGTNYGDSNVETLLASGSLAGIEISAGNIMPAANNVFSLGNASLQWKDLWVSSSTIYINSVPLSGGAGNTLTYNNQPVVVASNTSSPVTSNIATTANVVAGNLVVANTVPGSGVKFADGTLQTTAAIPYANANVAGYLPIYGGNILTSILSTGASNLAILGTTIKSGVSPITIDPLGDGAPTTGNVLILGNLSVSGNVTYVDVSTALTSNLVWQAANSANTAPAASGGGLAVGPAGSSYATWTYNNTSNSWVSNIAITARGGANINGPLSGATVGSFSGDVTAAHFIGNGSTLSSITGANVVGAVTLATTANMAATVTTAAQPNITSVGNVVGISASGLVSTTGNIAGQYVLGNGAFLTGLPAGYGNANLANLGSNAVSTTGNITAARFFGDAGGLTNVQVAAGTQIVNGTSNVSVSLNGNATFNISGSSGVMAVSPSGASLAGDVTAARFIGNGAALSGITGANVTGYVANATHANIADVANAASVANSVAGANVSGQVANALVAGTVYTAAQPNITSVGTLSSLSVTGAVVAGSVGGAAGNLVMTGNVLSTTGNSITIDPLGDGLPSTGNVNILGNLRVSGNLTYVDINTATTSNLLWQAAASATSPIAATGGGMSVGNAAAPFATLTYNGVANLWVSNIGIASSGNLSGTYIIGNGATLSGITGANVTGQVANALVSGTVYTAAQPNITSLGNLTGVSASGIITTTGNISGSYILGNGAFLTGLPAGYANSNASAYFSSGSANANIITTANISGAYILGNGSQLTGLPASYSNANVTALLSSGNVTSNITTTGNINASYFFGDGSRLTNINAGNIAGSYGNANVGVYLASNTNTTGFSTTGNVAGNLIVGNGSTLASITGSNVTGYVANAVHSNIANVANVANSVTTASWTIVESAGDLYFQFGGVNKFKFSATGGMTTL